MREDFGQRSPRFIDESSFAKFGVIVPFIQKNKEWYLVYEQRADHLKVGAREICFPGGRIEEGESPYEAAVRELSEELFLQSTDFKYWGAADILISQGSHMIYPYVGQLEEIPTTFNEEEVKRLLWVPIKELRQPSIRSFVRTTTKPADDFPYQLIQKGRAYPWMQRKVKMPFYITSQCVIWGMTARITENVIELIKKYQLLDD